MAHLVALLVRTQRRRNNRSRDPKSHSQVCEDYRPGCHSGVSDAAIHSRNMAHVFHVFKANMPDTSNCVPTYSPRIDGDIYVVPPVPLAAELYPSSKNLFIV